MRKVTLGLATSLDNFIARPDGGADWLLWTSEIAEISARFMKTVDAILIGRKTYEVMLASGETSYPGGTNYVFSRSKQKLSRLSKTAAGKRPIKNLKFISEDAAVFVQKLKKKPGKGIVIFGGGELAAGLFANDLIDEVVLNVHPVILGSGIPLFPETKHQIELELFKTKPLKNGCIVLSYRIKR